MCTVRVHGVYNYCALSEQAMESKLLRGGKNIVDHTNEQQRALEQRRQEIAEQQVSWLSHIVSGKLHADLTAESLITGWSLFWKTRKVRELKSGQGKVRENRKNQGKVRENELLQLFSCHDYCSDNNR